MPFGLATALVVTSAATAAAPLDLAGATVVVRSGERPAAEATAARVLVEEVERRTGLRWPIATQWPEGAPVIALNSGPTDPGWGRTVPRREGAELPENRPEGFRLRVAAQASQPPIVWITGADGRGALFGVGQFLRQLEWVRGQARFPAGLDLASAPVQRIRGHQLGYRHRANSWDGWDQGQFEQYIRELTFFGANSIENIPFEDTRPSPHLRVPREVMNRALSEICVRYDVDYWIWVPADFDLQDEALRAAALDRHAALFRDCPRLNGVFVPGGDPGHNEPELVMPYLRELAQLLAPHHPQAKVWLSLQGFNSRRVDYVHDWIREHTPAWFGGLVAGPSSPSIPQTRARLPRQYGLRDYPDITHTVRCQYPVPWWDPAYNFTLGREPCNPRPAFYKRVQNWLVPHDDGFITYSDGVHDDVNKAIWSGLGWDPEASPRSLLVEYARCFFGSPVAELAADGILALERNWEGPLAGNGGVDATLALWQQLEGQAPELAGDWRWQLCLMRAYYDAYTRHRLLYESALEQEANRALARAPARGAGAAIEAALAVLNRAVADPVKPAWRARIESLCQALFESVQLQTSVPKHQASGAERGAILDFVDYPLNNRWWLEDEFQRIRALPDEAERARALEAIRRWEHPGPGSFYDEVGHVGKSPRVLRNGASNLDPLLERTVVPGFWWWQEGLSRTRLSWQTSMDWPAALVYEHLEPTARYRVRLTGYGEVKLRLNGELASPTVYGKEIGQFKEFPVPSHLLEGGTLRLTFDPLAESHLNWRQQSRVSEVWLIKED
ncbi:MAG: hypothetical protein FJ387_04470 [Verrucomicrobia bacterium]|nr:hypothetical protein [Verrucomicrobiota bacterium]